MKKLFLLKTVLLLCALVVGSNSVWADTDVTITMSQQGWSDATDIGTGTLKSAVGVNSIFTYSSGTGSDGANAGPKYYNTGTNVRFYSKKNGDGQGNYMQINVPENTTITGVEITGVSSYTPDVKYNIDGGSDVSWTASDNKYTVSGISAASSFKFRNAYQSTSDNKQLRITAIKITYTTSSGDNPTISANPSSLSGFTYVKGNGPSTTKTVSVSGSNLTEDISLSLGESSNYEMCLTENGTYTNSLALTPTTGTVSATNVYVRLKSGLTAGDKSGSITLTSSDATDVTINLSGSVTTLAVTYDANGAGSGTVPTDANEYAYNAEVTVLGNTGSLAKEHNAFGGWNTQNDGEGTNYSADATFNITANTTLYAKWIVNTNSVTLPDDDEYGNYSMNKSNPVAYGTEVTLTYTPAEGYENYVATWSVNGEKISGNKFDMPDEAVTITVSLNEVFNMTLSNSDIVAAGDAVSGYGSKTITDSKGKTWNAYAIKNYHSNKTTDKHFLQIRAYASSTAYYIKVPEYGRKITKLEMTVSSTSTTIDGGGNSATLFFSASNSTSATGTGVASGTGASKVTIDCSDLDLNTGYITASGAVRIWDVKVTYDPIRLNNSGYATYAGLTPINYSDGSKFTAWAITEISGDAITFSKITGSVPAGTGVLLMGTAGQAVEPVVAASGTAPTTNLLTGITAATTVTADEYYGLSGNTFVPVSAGKVPAGRALLPVSEIPSQARQLNFVFEDGETTGIHSIENGKLTIDNYYNLNGQRVNANHKGIVIVNGKKFFNK